MEYYLIKKPQIIREKDTFVFVVDYNNIRTIDEKYINKVRKEI